MNLVPNARPHQLLYVRVNGIRQGRRESGPVRRRKSVPPRSECSGKMSVGIGFGRDAAEGVLEGELVGLKGRRNPRVRPVCSG